MKLKIAYNKITIVTFAKNKKTMNTLSNLQPSDIWTAFDVISKVPRASKKEEKIRSLLIEFAEKLELEYKVDEAGNLLIKKAASAGLEHKTALILQCHMDMVCEKNSDSSHNFDTNAIQTYIDGDWVKAKETTLGADNGIGLAMQLAVLSNKTLVHPPIECLFTTDEETGLYGATNLNANLLTGKTLINLDTEEEGEFCIGCAGGMDTLATVTYTPETSPEGLFFFDVKVSGLQGGHSGEDINKGRGNAIKILAEYLAQVNKKSKLRIAKIDGGNLRNAIAREASALLAVPYADKELVRVEINIYIAELESKIGQHEPKIRLELDSTEQHPNILPKEVSDKLIEALVNCPHGVKEMNAQIPTLVETSTNLAAIHTFNNYIFIETSQRSALENKKKQIAEEVAKCFEQTGAKIEKGKDYPGWAPNMQSPILETSKTAYSRLFGKDAIIKIIHAGLECGVISKKYPELDMISIGPTIENPHSPSEKVCISSVQKSWELLVEILKTV